MKENGDDQEGDGEDKLGLESDDGGRDHSSGISAGFFIPFVNL